MNVEFMPLENHVLVGNGAWEFEAHQINHLQGGAEKGLWATAHSCPVWLGTKGAQREAEAAAWTASLKSPYRELLGVARACYMSRVPTGAKRQVFDIHGTVAGGAVVWN
jgi:hypothetical protein